MKDGDRTAWNSNLRPGKPLGRDPEKPLRSTKKLKRRTLKERYGHDPLSYGVLFEKVREWPCAGKVHLPHQHRCGPGYRPPTAHHLGKTDVEGLVPCCGALHDAMEERTKEVDQALREAGKPSLAKLGQAYVRTAARIVAGQGRLPKEVAAALEPAP